MSVIILVGQVLLGAPFVVFAYWYQREEEVYRGTPSHPALRHPMVRHAAFGIFFSLGFAILGMAFFPPVTGTITLIACIYVFMRALDNLEYDKVAKGQGQRSS
jgi:hypothetical protein